MTCKEIIELWDTFEKGYQEFLKDWEKKGDMYAQGVADGFAYAQEDLERKYWDCLPD